MIYGAFSNRNFLALSGIEFHPEIYLGAPAHHLLGYGLSHPYAYNNNLSAPFGADLQSVPGYKRRVKFTDEASGKVA